MRQNARAVQSSIDRMIFWGLVAVIALLPAVVYGTELQNVSPTISGIGPIDTGTFANSFIMVKFGLVVLAAVFLGGLFVYKLFGADHQLEPNPLHLPIITLFVLLLVSLMLSPFPTIALNGYYDLREGTTTFLCYLALLVVAMHTVYPAKELRWLVYALIPFTVLNAVLGMLQLGGVSPIDWPFVKSLMYPPSVKVVPDSVRFTTTLGNANYASGFAGMCTVIFLTMALLVRERKERIVMLAMSFASFTVILSSLSQSGFISLVLLLPFIAFAAWRYGLGRQTLATGVVALVGFLVIYAAAYSAQPAVYTETVGFFSALVQGPPAAETAPPPATAAPPAPASGDLPILAQAGWSFGTGRSYIWKRSLEILQKRPLVGYGLDTIAYVFPQLDPDKIANMSSGFVVITKPHSFYVGLAFGAGIPALLAFLTMIGVVAWLTFQKVFTTRELNPVLVALTMGWLAYLVQGLVNDSMIGYSAVFWVMLGVAVSLLRSGAREAALTKRARTTG